MIGKKIKIFSKFSILVFLEVAIFVILFSFFFNFNISNVGGYVNSSNVTVITYLEVGNVYPEVLNVSVNNGAAITLVPNATKLVVCEALLRDWNNDTDIQAVTAVFFGNTTAYAGADDNNSHYSNSSCDINRTFGSWKGVADDDYLAVANCTFNLWYNADPVTWNCTVFVNDTAGTSDIGSSTTTVSQLLAIGLPDSINYGIVNSTYVSNEQIANVTNFGNVMLNLSLQGYAVNPWDNLSMNCTLGSIKNISIGYEKYNLTASNPTDFLQNLTNFSLFYKNLTSNVSGVLNKFNLNYRQDEGYNEAVNATYWRIYVPKGVAGTCSGNIVFGARRAAG